MDWARLAQCREIAVVLERAIQELIDTKRENQCRNRHEREKEKILSLNSSLSNEMARVVDNYDDSQVQNFERLIADEVTSAL